MTHHFSQLQVFVAGQAFSLKNFLYLYKFVKREFFGLKKTYNFQHKYHLNTYFFSRTVLIDVYSDRFFDIDIKLGV